MYALLITSLYLSYYFFYFIFFFFYLFFYLFFFFNDTATTEIYTLSLHDALPIFSPQPISAGDGRVLNFGNWRLNLSLRRLQSKNGTLVDLSTSEFDLLAALAERPQQVLSRDQLLDLTRGQVEMPFDRKIDMQVSRLRHKIEEDPRHPDLIQTVRGGGYVFTAKVERDEKPAA